MKFVFERIVRGAPMSDADFKDYEWHSDLVDKIAATVVTRHGLEEAEGRKNMPTGGA